MSSMMATSIDPFGVPGSDSRRLASVGHMGTLRVTLRPHPSRCHLFMKVGVREAAEIANVSPIVVPCPACELDFQRCPEPLRALTRSSATCGSTSTASRSCCARSTISCRPRGRTICSPGRGGLTKREIARHSPADAENYDAYSRGAERRRRRAAPMAAARAAQCRRRPRRSPRPAQARRRRRPARPRAAAPPRRFLHQVGGRHPQPLFQPRARPGPVRLRRRRRPLCQPLCAGLGLCPAPPRLRRGGGRRGRLGPCDRRHGRDHPGDGQGRARGGRRDRPRHAGRGSHRRGRQGGGRRRRRQGVPRQGGGRRRASQAPVHRAAARRRGRRRSRPGGWRIGRANRRPSG